MSACDSFCERFHLLPEEIASNHVELSSDEDDTARSTTTAQELQDDEEEEAKEPATPSAQACATTSEFRNTIARLVPIHLIDPSVRRHIRLRANQALRMAAEQGRAVADLRIDDHCLPCWPVDPSSSSSDDNNNGRCVWDPEAESLHKVAQRLLGDHQAAMQISGRVRELVVRLGNERLREAAAAEDGGGLEIVDIVIGKDLLPTWASGMGEGDEDLEDEDLEDEGLEDDSGEDGNLVDENVDDDGNSDDGGNVDGSKGKEAGSKGESKAKEGVDSSDEDSSDDESGDESDDDSMRGLFHSQDHYNDRDSSPVNIIHDVLVTGASSDDDEVMDFEVYLAQNDSDVEQLPEAEPSIDEEAFARYHGLTDVVEIDLGRGVYHTVPRISFTPDQAQ